MPLDSTNFRESQVRPTRFVKRALGRRRWLAAAAMIAWAALMLIISVSPTFGGERPLAKTVQSYALTSGNDFPQRDPLDWRLSGSNDGGKTWTTLDIRKGELFTERHQRRLFKLNNRAAFTAYRLQIERVLDPRVANSVQLAEIELMGAENDPSPTPVFSDVITAHGDNPPSETVQQLFDGRAETKWLDRPANRETCASWIQWEYVVPDGMMITNISQLRTLRARAGDGYQVQLQAVVVGRCQEGAGWCVVDATGCLEIGKGKSADELRPGQRVVITGASEWSGTNVGLRVDRLEPRGAGPERAEPIELEQPLPPGENLKWVEIQGELRYSGWTGREGPFDVEEGGASMRVYPCCPRVADLPPPGTRVGLRGICQGAFTEQGQWVASTLWAAGWEPLAQSRPVAGQALVAAPRKSGVVASNVFTKIGQIRRLTQEELKSWPQVRLRGILTKAIGIFLQDDTAGIEINVPADAGRKLTEPCMFVEVEGRGGLGDVGSLMISAERIEVLGRGKPPQPQPFSLNQLLNGRGDGQWIQLEGVVRSTDGAHLLMICAGREVTATIGEGAAGTVNQLVDAFVRVRGVGVTALDDQSRIQGVHLLIPSLQDVEVLGAPPNPGNLPVQPIGSLLGLSGPRESFHRVKVEGTVTYNDEQRLFVQDSTGGAMALFKQNVILDPRFGRSRWLFWRAPQSGKAAQAGSAYLPGQRVEVLGFPETRGYSPVLTEVTVRKLGDGKPVRPQELTELGTTDGRRDAALVTFDGILRAQNTIGSHMVMQLEWHDRMLQVLVPVSEIAVSKIVSGSQLRVTGVSQSDPAPYAELGLRVAGVRILTRSAADIQVLARPLWWTVRRALAVMGVMALIIVGALIWIKQLRSQVEERTAQLGAEIRLREQTERQRALEEERARIAKDLHDDLGANLTQIVFLSQRVEAETTEREEGRPWFSLIPATARKTIQSLDEIVWAINPRHDSVESLANYLSQFAQEHLTLAGIRCVLEVPTVLPAVVISAECRHNLVLAAREAIQNVVNHAAPTTAQVALRLDDSSLTIEIADNGRGFEPRTINGDGNGLSNMRRRVEDLGGRFELESTPGKGTTVRFVIPRERLHGRVIGTSAGSPSLS